MEGVPCPSARPVPAEKSTKLRDAVQLGGLGRQNLPAPQRMALSPAEILAGQATDRAETQAPAEVILREALCADVFSKPVTCSRPAVDPAFRVTGRSQALREGRRLPATPNRRPSMFRVADQGIVSFDLALWRRAFAPAPGAGEHGIVRFRNRSCAPGSLSAALLLG